MRIERKENANGGKGTLILKHILEGPELNGKCRMYAQVTLAPGAELGYHEHIGESETYFILSGVGEYNDDGATRTVTAGEKTFTPSGHGHGIANPGTEDLVFMALIILE